MNPRTFGSSIWLLAIVAVTVLCIGAFTRFDTSHGEGNATASNPPAAESNTPPPESPLAATSAAPLSLPANLSPGLAEVIKLAQSHIADETILAFIQTSGQTYKPTADEILYLSDLGVSDKVVNALFKKPDLAAANPATPDLAERPAPPEPSPAAAPASPAADPAPAPEAMMNPPPTAVEEAPPLQNPQDSYFFDSLSSYGSWVQLADGTWAWQPMASSVNPDWVPYRDRGHWLLTDDGWYWASDYAWGWAAFHYGRWSHQSRYGWVWHPGSVWAPAWVAWRNSDTYSGWAPLPPGAPLQLDAGLAAGQGQAGFDASFGLSASWFTFVTYDNFLSRRVASLAAPAARAAGLFKSSTPVNNYSVSGRRVLNLGVPPERIADATKTPVKKYALQDAAALDGIGRGKSGRGGQTLAVFRPDLSPGAAPAPPGPINGTARKDEDGDTMQKVIAPRTAAEPAEAFAEAERPADPGGEVRAEPALASLRPAVRTSQPDLEAPPGGTRTFSSAGGDYRRAAASGETGSGYSGQPSYARPAYNPAPTTEAAYSQRGVPAYASPPAESRSGQVLVSSGPSSASSSGSSKTVNK